MKKYPKVIQADKRGQIVIPKDVRQELGIDESTGFFVYAIPGEGILLKQVEPQPLGEDKIIAEITKHAQTLGVDPEAIKKTIADYKTTKGGLEEL